MTYWPFDHLRPLSYGVILADPPWRYSNWSEKGERKNPTQKYSCMSLEDIKVLPVNHLATDNCILWMWATWPMLPQALDVMKAWGFRYVTGGAWAKRSKTGKKWAFGTGYVLRCASEPFLIGAIGSPEYGPDARRIRGLIEAPIRQHSRKPDHQYEMLEKMVPTAFRAEIFARQKRLNWDSWGNETDKYTGENHEQN